MQSVVCFIQFVVGLLLFPLDVGEVVGFDDSEVLFSRIYPFPVFFKPADNGVESIQENKNSGPR